MCDLGVGMGLERSADALTSLEFEYFAVFGARKSEPRKVR